MTLNATDAETRVREAAQDCDDQTELVCAMGDHSVLTSDLRTLLASLATLREERQKERVRLRSAFCTYCGHATELWQAEDEDAKQKAYAAIIAHDAVCPKNPHLIQLAGFIRFAESLRVAFGGDESLTLEGTHAHITAKLASLTAEVARLKEDGERLDWLEDIIRGSLEDGYVEVYLSGLRHGDGPAAAFQFETNPNHLGTLNRATLRDALDAASSGATP